MTSTVTATTRASVAEIMAALFPCASITGAPKPRTMRLIRELEPTPRRIYTGAIGFLAPGGLARRRAQFNVAIRTVLVDRATGQAEYGVGGGIVWDSVADDEYAECQIKARVLTARPPTFALLESLRWTPEAGYFLLERHLGRLRDSAAYFSFALDIGRAREQLAALAGGLPAIAHKVRLLVAQDGDLQVEAAPLPEPEPAPGPLGLHLALTPLSPADVFLYHKTTQRQIYDRARAARPGADDVLLWNERGEITETTVGNVAVQLDGEWFTPPVECGLLAGTYRALLLDEGRIRERTITREMLSRSQGLAVVNSVRLWRAARLSSIEW
jgi:para-aminobenzoate synthetase/4-amino-4-deoxychorismate lyase